LGTDLEIDGGSQSASGASLCATPIVFADSLRCDTFTGANFRAGAKTILLVEDEEFVRRLTGEVLTSAGYQLMTASSPAAALKLCLKCCEPIDLLLADVVMPGMSGRELAAEFRNFYPSVEILLMSGYPEELALCALSAGKATYLAKPFSIDLLLQRVRKILAA
jgi:CheY-like chemotaxis protein